MDKKFKIFVTTAIIILTLAVVGAIGLVVGMNPKGETTKEETAIDKKDLEIIYLDSHINSNLALSKDNIPHIIRMSVAFEIYTKADDYKDVIVEFTNKQVIVRNHIINMLRELTYDALSEEGSQQHLADTIKKEINTLFKTEIIQNVYFGELFVQ